MNLVNECPSISDNWQGGLSDVSRVLGVDRKTVHKYSLLGPRNGGIDWKPGKRGRVYTGKAVKKLWRLLRFGY